MITTTCRHVTLAEIKGLGATDLYEAMVRPLSYEFDLRRDSVYCVLGVVTRRGTPWLYVASAEGDKEIQIVPAPLFTFAWNEVPSGWRIRMNGGKDIELLPSSLAAVEAWFERYVDNDSAVIGLVEREIDRCRGGNEGN